MHTTLLLVANTTSLSAGRPDSRLCTTNAQILTPSPEATLGLVILEDKLLGGICAGTTRAARFGAV